MRRFAVAASIGTLLISAAIAQEYQNCQANILRRFAIGIEVAPLSLGLLSSS